MKPITKVTMKHLCLIFTLMAFTTYSQAQFVGDTVTIYVEGKAEVKISIDDFNHLAKSDSVKLALQDFTKFIADIEDKLSPQEAELIKYKVGGELSIEPGDPKIVFLSEDKQLINTGFRDRAIITGESYTIFITSADISLMKELDLTSCMEELKAKLPEKVRWSKSLFYDCSNSEVKEINSKNNEMDFLGLQFGAGAGLIKSQWVADISFGVNLGLNHKGIPRSPYISTNMIFDFDAEENMNINTFLNVGYSFNVGNKTKKPNMLGLELGYLIAKQGDLFGDNTFKFGVNWSPAKHINVTPQLFITDNFKQVFPGVRIGFGF